MRLDAEKIILAVFFALMLWLGPGTMLGHELSHGFPYGYLSSDAYQHQVRAEWVKEQGSYARESLAIVSGFTDVIGYYMPGTSQIAAALSYATGLQSYDALYFLIYFAAIMSALVVYFGLREYNRHVALLALPATTLIFTHNFYIGILLGQWPFIMGTMFLAATFWALTRLDWQKSALLLALFTAAVAMTHTSELVFIVGLLGLAFLMQLLKKNAQGMKKIIAAGIIAAAASIYYLIIFAFTWGKQFGYSFMIERVNMGFPNVTIFGDFQLWIILVMLAGMIGIYFRKTVMAVAISVAALAAVKALDIPDKINSDALAVIIYFIFLLAIVAVVVKRKPELAEVFAPYMLLIGFSSFIGFGARAFQTRFMWPVTLAPIFAIGAYKAMMLAGKYAKVQWKMSYTVIAAVILAVAILGLNYNAISTQGSMYKERWEMFTWLQDNAEEGSRVFFFYGDGYSQTSMLYNAGKSYVYINEQDYIATLNNRTVKRDYQYSLHGDYGPGYPYRTGLLDFKYHIDEPTLGMLQGDACLFEYYVFDKATGNAGYQPVMQYNSFIRSVFEQHGMQAVFENAATAVLKNNNPGGECIG